MCNSVFLFNYFGSIFTQLSRDPTSVMDGWVISEVGSWPNLFFWLVIKFLNTNYIFLWILGWPGNDPSSGHDQIKLRVRKLITGKENIVFNEYRYKSITFLRHHVKLTFFFFSLRVRKNHGKSHLPRRSYQNFWDIVSMTEIVYFCQICRTRAVLSSAQHISE